MDKFHLDDSKGHTFLFGRQTVYIRFDVVDTLLVIQKLDDKDKRLPGWEFKVTDPGWNTATYTTDHRGEIRIVVPGEYGGGDLYHRRSI